ncbi:MAG: hypothetical protein Q4C20_16300, partial [Erysipelotrichaceae bacterium]|nr:hypothetical protein [Erysipelotrichaceae bacterium]
YKDGAQGKKQPKTRHFGSPKPDSLIAEKRVKIRMILPAAYKLAVRKGISLEDGFSQTEVWGKQSVWLSACRCWRPLAVIRAEARAHFKT